MVKLKRIAAALVSAALLISTLPQVMAAETEAVEYFTASATAGDSNGVYGNYGDYMGIIGTSNTAPELGFSINLKNSGTYDIWLDSNVAYKDFTGYKMNKDANWIENSGTQCGSDTSIGLYGVATGWHKVDTRQLSAGVNTLKVGATKQDAANNNRYVSLVRGVAVVPKYYNWDPTKSGTPQLWADPVEYFSASATEGDSNGIYGNYGEFMGIIGTSDTAPEIVFGINLKKNGIYDIWLDSSVGSWKGYTGYKMKDDANWIENSGNQYGDNTSTGLDGVATGWHKADTRLLSAGVNTLRVGASKKDTANNDRYVSVVRGVAIVPRSYNWDPTKSATPQPCADPVEYFTASATKADISAAYLNYSEFMGLIADSATVPELDFSINLKNTDKYDIWLDSNVAYKDLTGYKMNDDAEWIENGGTQCGANTSTGLYGVSTGWFKVNSRQLSAGVNTLRVGASKKDTTYNRYVSLVRGVAVVPSSWEWSPVNPGVPNPIAITDIQFTTDISGTILNDKNSLSVGDEVYVKVTYKNTSSEAKTFAVIGASYNSERMATVGIENITAAAGQDGTKYIKVKIEDTSDLTIKGIILDSFDNMKPLLSSALKL
ncbi:MAG: hypothetical protein PUF72_07775 [Clostridiales bacterium]|nr:hypothetical protein [Clostridiales bacterium]